MRRTTILLVLPAILALAACGQNRREAANDGTLTNTTDGAVITDGAGAGTSGMVPAPGEAIPATDPMANPGIPGADLNTGPGNSNTGPGNDGSPGTRPTGANADAPGNDAGVVPPPQ